MLMKKNALSILLILFTVTFFSCRSAPEVYAPPSISPAKYKNLYIEFDYNPEYLITVFDKRDIVENLTKRINDLGLFVTTKPERADMILKINIDTFLLSERNPRLRARSTFGLVDGESLMIFTATFMDNKTFKEITKTTETYKISKFFPSKEEIKEKFFDMMKDDILKYMSQYKSF
jgi:hypothetical protein